MRLSSLISSEGPDNTLTIIITVVVIVVVVLIVITIIAITTICVCRNKPKVTQTDVEEKVCTYSMCALVWYLLCVLALSRTHPFACTYCIKSSVVEQCS